MIYVYAPSMSIIVYAAHRWPFSELCIITYNNAIIKFCNKLNIKYIEINKPKGFTYKDLKDYKNYIINNVKNYKKKYIIFNFNANDYWGLYFLLQLEKQNDVCFVNNSIIYNKYSNYLITKKIIRLLIDKFIIYSITGIRFNVLTFNNRYFLGFSKKKIYKYFNFTQRKSDNKILTNNRNLINQKYGLDSKLAILVDQGDIFYSYNEKIVKAILDINLNYTKIFIKQHPTFKTKNTVLLNSLSEIPYEIPIDLIIDEETIVIGIASEALKQNYSISIIDLVNIDNKTKEKYKEFLKSANVKFPNSIQSLLELINTKL